VSILPDGWCTVKCQINTKNKVVASEHFTPKLRAYSILTPDFIQV